MIKKKRQQFERRQEGLPERFKDVPDILMPGSYLETNVKLTVDQEVNNLHQRMDQLGFLNPSDMHSKSVK